VVGEYWMEADRVEQSKVRLARFMARTNRKNTRQREVIVDVFLTLDQHVSLQELLDSVQRREPGVGFATVYRTMKLLVEAGVAYERQFAHGNTQYEPVGLVGEHHDHLMCELCGLIVEFEDPVIERRQTEVAEAHGINITSHRHEIYGSCQDTAGCEARQAADG